MKPPEHLSSGEWKLDPLFAEHYMDVVRAGPAQTIIVAEVWGDTNEEVEANARLIAASKRIAEAAAAFLNQIDNEGDAWADELKAALLDAGWTE
jgi:hypothetical protein